MIYDGQFITYKYGGGGDYPAHCYINATGRLLTLYRSDEFKPVLHPMDRLVETSVAYDDPLAAKYKTPIECLASYVNNSWLKLYFEDTTFIRQSDLVSLERNGVSNKFLDKGDSANVYFTVRFGNVGDSCEFHLSKEVYAKLHPLAMEREPYVEVLSIQNRFFLERRLLLWGFNYYNLPEEAYIKNTKTY